MLPLLRECDLDGALLARWHKVDAAATPEHAAQLKFFAPAQRRPRADRAPLAFVLIVGWALLVLVPPRPRPRLPRRPVDPHPGPAARPHAGRGRGVRDGRSARRALTTAMLDLASRGLIAFQAEDKPGCSASGHARSASRPTGAVRRDDPVEQARLRAGPPARRWTRAPRSCSRRLAGIGGGSDGYIDPDDILKLGTRRRRRSTSARGARRRPGLVRGAAREGDGRWVGRGVLAIVAGIVAVFVGVQLPSDGLVLVGVVARRGAAS